MKQAIQKQQPDPEVIFLALRRLGITQYQVAKRLRRSQTSICFALRGMRPRLLERIAHFVEKHEQNAA